MRETKGVYYRVRQSFSFSINKQGGLPTKTLKLLKRFKRFKRLSGEGVGVSE